MKEVEDRLVGESEKSGPVIQKTNSNRQAVGCEEELWTGNPEAKTEAAREGFWTNNLAAKP